MNEAVTLLVLVVENDPDISKMWDIYIEGLGHQVILLNTVDLVVESCVKHRPDAILLGKELQGKDRRAIYEHVNNHPATKNTPMVMMPPEITETETSKQSIEDQKDRFLHVPFDIEDVKRFLQQVAFRSR